MRLTSEVLTKVQQSEKLKGSGSGSSLTAAGKIYSISSPENKHVFPDELTFKLGSIEFNFVKKTWICDDIEYQMRYGTNPSQVAALYENKAGSKFQWKFLKMGKQGPSATNIEDINQGIEIIKFFDQDRHAAVILKHLIPSGFCVGNNGESQEKIYQIARDVDYLSSFGGVVVFNTPLEMRTAQLLAQSFIEVIAAPKISRSIVNFFRNDVKKENLRIVEFGDLSNLPKYKGDDISYYYRLKMLLDGSFLIETPFVSQICTVEDLIFHGFVEHEEKIYRVERIPDSLTVLQDLLDSWHVLEGTRSNAVVIMKNGRAICGAGTTKRVDAVIAATEKARKYSQGLQLPADAFNERFTWSGAVGASDGFPPFDDTIIEFSRAGVEYILVPPGGKNIHNIISTANRLNISLIFTPTNARCFTH